MQQPMMGGGGASMQPMNVSHNIAGPVLMPQSINKGQQNVTTMGQDKRPQAVSNSNVQTPIGSTWQDVTSKVNIDLNSLGQKKPLTQPARPTIAQLQQQKQQSAPMHNNNFASNTSSGVGNNDWFNM